MEEETICHLFYFFTYLEDTWNQVQTYFIDCLPFSQLTQQTAIFGFHNNDTNTFLSQNHILLLLKLHIYDTRKYGVLSFKNFLNKIRRIKNLERRIAVNSRNKCERMENKLP